MSTSGCCCCCGARSASSRCCVDYSRLIELQSQSSSERRPPSTVDQSSLVDVRCSAVLRPCVDGQPSPTLHRVNDDDDDGGRATVLQLTTFKPSLQPSPTACHQRQAETNTADKAQIDDTTETAGSSDLDRSTTKQQLAAASMTPSVTSTTAAVVSSAALERLQPDLLPLMTSAAAEDAAVINAMISGPDDLL